MSQTPDTTTDVERAPAPGWRDAVPPLPLRFSVVLTRPDRPAVEALRQQVVGGAHPQLRLKRSAKATEVVLADDGTRIGNLPARDTQMLADLGVDAELYTPHILSIRHNDKGKLDHVAVELVRPAVRYCSACGEPHSGAYINCEKCRARRRPKGEEAFEQPPISFHEELDASVKRDEPDPGF